MQQSQLEVDCFIQRGQGAMVDDSRDSHGRDLQVATERAFEEYEAGVEEPLYDAFVNQARVSIWRVLQRDDPTLCHHIAERALLRIKTFRGESSISTWFYTIAENECKRELRRLIRDRERHVSLDYIEPGGNDSESLAKHADRIFKATRIELETQTRLRELLLAQLPDEQAKVLELRNKGYSFKEIAAQAGISPSTASSRFRLAKKKLEKNLSKSDKKWLRKGLIL